MPKFTNLPNQGQIWKVGNEHYYVINAPKGGGKLAWKFRSKSALKSAFPGGGVKVSRRMSKNKFKSYGATQWGFTDEIQNTKNPWAQFLQNYKKEARINPMLKDPEVVAIYAQAVIEGRTPTRAEVETTDWWRSRTAEQRAWVQLASGDPKTAKMIKRRNRLETRDALVSAGFQGNAYGAAAALADQFTSGTITKQELEEQVRRRVDPHEPNANKFAGRYLPEGTSIVKNRKNGKVYARYQGQDYELGTKDAMEMFAAVNPRMVNGIAGENTGRFVSEIVSKPFEELSAQAGVAEVADMVQEHLGPKFAKGWTNRAIEKWAHDIRGNENMQTKLEEELKRQRSAVLPGYDENLTYEQIATPWRSVVRDAWGREPDETDPLFYQILKANDIETAGKLLRSEGIKRGVGKVQADAAKALSQSFGGQVAGVMGG